MAAKCAPADALDRVEAMTGPDLDGRYACKRPEIEHRALQILRGIPASDSFHDLREAYEWKSDSPKGGRLKWLHHIKAPVRVGLSPPFCM